MVKSVGRGITPVAASVTESLKKPLTENSLLFYCLAKRMLKVLHFVYHFMQTSAVTNHLQRLQSRGEPRKETTSFIRLKPPALKQHVQY